jgi:lipopolysaccharide export system protein LptA
MTLKNLEHQAIFEGDVVMKKEDLTVTSDHAEVTFASQEDPTENHKPPTGLLSPESQFRDNEITLIHATGNVVLQHGGKKVYSKEAFYYQNEEKIILLGEPVAWEKDYRVTGTKMTIFLRENRSIVEGSKVIIQPKDQAQKNSSIP